MGIKKNAKNIWRGMLKTLKWVRNIPEMIVEKPIVIGVLLFILIGFFVVNTTLKRGKSYEGDFLDNILVEAHGLLFDIFVFGILIIVFNIISERKREIRRYIEEIDDYREWDEKEATHRIAGNIKRLNKRGITKIDLQGCFLKDARLYEANLQEADLSKINLQGAKFWGTNLQGAKLGEANLRGADLRRANLQGAYLAAVNLRKAALWGANLQGANLSETNLQGAKYIKIIQLSKAETLYKAKLDPELEKEIKEKYPHLFEEPELPDGWGRRGDE